MQRIEGITRNLLAYCGREDWAGYDPYDALNSEGFPPIFLEAKWSRLVFTQLLKRLPLNLRPLLRIPKTQNPKGLALSLAAVIKLQHSGIIKDNTLRDQLACWIKNCRSPGEYWCWGYSFPWQGRAILVNRGEPNLVCTTFVAESLLDLFEEAGDTSYLEIASSAADYLLNELFWTDDKTIYSFGYPTSTARSKVHNANLMGAAFLLRCASYSGDERAREIALKVATYAVSCQRADGSWPYGEYRKQHWIDNFHTGYNLCALRRIAKYGNITRFDANIEHGYQFYCDHFFRQDGAPKYFHDHAYPLDVHCVAQSIITSLEFADRDSSAQKRAHEVLSWALENLWDPRGYFYYRRGRWGVNRISYMRWAQAWMLLALATLEEKQRQTAASPPGERELTPTISFPSLSVAL